MSTTLGVSVSKARVYSTFGAVRTCSTGPCSTMRPALMTATVSAMLATSARLCVTNSMLRPHVALEVAKQLHDRGLHRRVERRRDLVADEQPRLGRKCAGDRDALALAAAQLVRVALGVVRG